MMTGLTPATRGRATDPGPDLPRPAQPRPPGRRHARRLRPAPRPHRPRGAPRRRHLDRGARRPASRRCSRSSASPTRRPAAASATTPSACASASASPRRCSASRRCSILDEPANGLDPQGIHWMRGLLRRFADGGGTVLLSSHLLHEVQIVADDLVMIGRGRIVAMGSKEELLSRGGTTVRSTDDARLARCSSAPTCPSRRTGSGLVVDAEPGVVGEIAARRARRPPRAALRRLGRPRRDVPRPHGRHLARRRRSMSTDRHPHPRRRRPDVGTARRADRPRRPSGRPVRAHVHAELRKMVDTRAGRWMVIVMAAAAAIVLAAFVIWGPAEDASFRGLLELATLPLAMLLPVLGIMAATAEWTPAHRAGHLHPRAAPRPGRPRQGARRARPRPRRLGVGGRGVGAGQRRRRHRRVGPRGTRPAGGLVLAPADLRPAGRGVRPAVPQHAGRDRRGPGAADRLDHRHDRPSPRSRTPAGGSTWTRSPRRCSPARWRARTGRSSAPRSRVWVLLPLAVGTYRVLHREVK